MFTPKLVNASGRPVGCNLYSPESEKFWVQMGCIN